MSKDPETIIRGEHIVNFLYRWQEFEGLAGPRAWVTSVVSDPRLLPIFLAAFVHEGQAHTLGDFVTHKMVSFRLDALLPFVELPEMLDAVRALSTDIDMTQRTAPGGLQPNRRHLRQCREKLDILAFPTQSA